MGGKDLPPARGVRFFVRDVDEIVRGSDRRLLIDGRAYVMP